MNTTKRTLGAATLAVMALLLMAGPGMAQIAPSGTAAKVIQLTQTKYGVNAKAEGMAKISVSKDGVETFGVVVFADVADSKTYAIEVTTPEGRFKVADLSMFLGVGVSQQTNLTRGTKAFPVARLQTVTVRDQNGVVLTGYFDPTTATR